VTERVTTKRLAADEEPWRSLSEAQRADGCAWLRRFDLDPNRVLAVEVARSSDGLTLVVEQPTPDIAVDSTGELVRVRRYFPLSRRPLPRWWQPRGLTW